MNDKKRKGIRGESLAAEYLQSKAYILLEKNWRSGKKEIDLIMQDNNIIVFVEVKTRTSIRFGMPEESVSETKAASVVSAAMDYLQGKTYTDIRFDIISVILKKDTEPEIFHIKDAFY